MQLQNGEDGRKDHFILKVNPAVADKKRLLDRYRLVDGFSLLIIIENDH